MFKLEVKIINPNIETKLPEVANKDEFFKDSGYDFFSAEEVIIEPGEQKLVSTNLALHQPYITLCGSFEKEWNSVVSHPVPIVFPIGLMAAQPSGVALKRRLRPKAGIIDSGYANEIKVLLDNEGDVQQVIYPREKIAQLIPHLVMTGEVVVVDKLSNENSGRGLHGWGSGIKS